MEQVDLNSASATVRIAVYGGIFSVFLVFAILEHVRPFRSTVKAAKGRWPINFQLTALNVAISTIIPMSFLTVALFAQNEGLGLFHVMDAPYWLGAIATLLVRAFISYYSHYISHKVPLLWRFHRVHHLDVEIDVSTTVRFHPFESFLPLVIGMPMVLALGLDPLILAMYELIQAPLNVFAHANIKLPNPIYQSLKYLLVTPNLHRTHHSSYQPETDSNYSDVFPIWDLVFGTFCEVPIERQATMELGLEKPRSIDRMNFFWLLNCISRDELADFTDDRASPAAKT